MKMRLKEKNIDRNFNSQEFITVKKKIIPKDYSLRMCSSFLNVGKIITINKKKNVKSIYFNNILAFSTKPLCFSLELSISMKS